MIKEVVDGLISTHHIAYYGGLFAFQLCNSSMKKGNIPFQSDNNFILDQK